MNFPSVCELSDYSEIPRWGRGGVLLHRDLEGNMRNFLVVGTRQVGKVVNGYGDVRAHTKTEIKVRV